jgi:hypothetical protein
MPPPELRYNPGKVPEGYAAIPISVSQKNAPIRLCALVRVQADPVGGHLVVLRDLVDARVFLGCIADSGDGKGGGGGGAQVHEWVEIWVQTIDGLGASLPAYRQQLSNSEMDLRWSQMVAAFDRFERPIIYKTGWEGGDGSAGGGGGGGRGAGAPVMLLDIAKREPVDAVDRETGDKWTLCTDDSLLAKVTLAPYTTSLDRYLYLPALEAASVFVPITRDSPTSASTKGMTEVEAGRTGLVHLNPGAGLMLVRSLGQLSLEAYTDLLTGGSWAGWPHGKTAADTGLSTRAQGSGATTGGGDGAADGGLFLGQQGKWGRLVETFHLKTRALADAIDVVRTHARTAQRPFLNLRMESFAVHLGQPARGLPHLWAARVTLVDPGSAVALPIKSSDHRYYVAPDAEAMTIFRPASAGRPTSGRATVRIREVLTQQGEQTVLEGTLATEEKIDASKNDLVWVRLSLGSSRVDLYGSLEADAALAKGEWRFRTLSQRHGAEESKQIQAAKGVPLTGSSFEIVPLVSTPCDLYSLGVLAVRILLCQQKSDLPVVLDEVLSLARQLAKEHDESVSLPTRIGAVFSGDPRWASLLGPHRLTTEKIEPAEALDLVPAALWYDTLGAIVRMFPGIGPDSRCTDLGDAREGGLHLVFDQALEDAERLIRKTRSLIVIDWNYNREIHAVVRQYLGGSPVSPGQPAARPGTKAR